MPSIDIYTNDSFLQPCSRCVHNDEGVLDVEVRREEEDRVENEDGEDVEGKSLGDDENDDDDVISDRRRSAASIGVDSRWRGEGVGDDDDDGMGGGVCDGGEILSCCFE